MPHTLYADPMPAPRPRAAKRGKFISIYNPSSYTKWKEGAAALLRAHAPVPPIATPVRVTVTFTCKRPKTTKLAAPKPDIDNYVKAFLDAMTDAEWWADDTLVHHLVATKRWGARGDVGLIHFTVEEINHAPET
jgi:Holliday junction resolvase RusA-like endonuclease